MIVWIFVEGQSDRIALDTLWVRWRNELRQRGWGIQVIPLSNKSCFLKKVGPRAAEKLANNGVDLVIGLPDLYPNQGYETPRYRHNSLNELIVVQKELVRESLYANFGCPDNQIDPMLSRFYPTAFKHDAEMLLLAAKNELRAVLGTRDQLGQWRHPVEEQDQTRPPKRIVEELFRLKLGQCYRETIHVNAVLARVVDIRTIYYNDSGQLQCPVFKGMVDWISAKTSVPAR